MERIALTCVLGFSSLVFAQGSSPTGAAPAVDSRDFRLGGLPAAGSVHDVLTCAGSNEVLWTEVIGVNPYDRDASEAKRKAGWYASVALNIFAVESQAVSNAVAAAKALPREKVYELARSCRAAPSGWRD